MTQSSHSSTTWHMGRGNGQRPQLTEAPRAQLTETPRALRGAWRCVRAAASAPCQPPPSSRGPAPRRPSIWPWATAQMVRPAGRPGAVSIRAPQAIAARKNQTNNAKTGSFHRHVHVFAGARIARAPSWGGGQRHSPLLPSPPWRPWSARRAPCSPWRTSPSRCSLRRRRRPWIGRRRRGRPRSCHPWTTRHSRRRRPRPWPWTHCARRAAGSVS
jgi:hypothetical protein